jgi:hypothetical protein
MSGNADLAGASKHACEVFFRSLFEHYWAFWSGHYFSSREFSNAHPMPRVIADEETDARCVSGEPNLL